MTCSISVTIFSISARMAILKTLAAHVVERRLPINPFFPA
jgi:hypothetical protein